jgi:hypothetical protein
MHVASHDLFNMKLRTCLDTGHSAGLLLPGIPDRRLRRTGIFTTKKQKHILETLGIPLPD